MSVLIQAYQSTVGKKIMMAVTGIVLVGFAVGHMAGNLKAFGGFNTTMGMYKIDLYGRFLRDIGSDVFGHAGFLWIMRIALLAAVILHAVSGIQLSALNRSARPVPYHGQKYGSANAASRTMFYGGLLLAVFIVYHLLHLTTGTLHFHGFVEGKVYSNLYLAFSNVPTAAFYVLAMAALTLHLYHGTWSMFQTLGVDHPRWNGGIRTAAKVIAAVLFVGFSAVPVAFAAGFLPAP